jgi:hypothetical protein
MIALFKRRLKDGAEYDQYFNEPEQETVILKKEAFLEDTISLMHFAIGDSLAATKKIAKVLKGATKYESCKNIWQFMYDHIQYTRDEEKKEQVRHAARTWADRVRGVDCDCYSVFAAAILLNMGIHCYLRIAMYNKEQGFQHVYVIVPDKQDEKGYIVIDVVLDKFNREHNPPIIRKEDYHITMDTIQKTADATELGAIPLLASLLSSGGAIAKITSAAGVASKGGGMLSNITSVVQNVGSQVKNILGIGKNKEGADAAEKALGEAQGKLASIKQTMPSQIAQLQQDQAALRQQYEQELNQLRQTLNSI